MKLTPKINYLILIIEIVGSGIIAGLGLFLGNWLYQWCMQPVIEWGRVDKLGEQTGTYTVSVRIRNTGKIGAEDVTAKISIDSLTSEDLEDRNPKQAFLSPDRFRKIQKEPLQWARKNKTEDPYITINSGDWEKIDVCIIPSSLAVIDVFSENKLDPARCRLSVPDKKEGELYRGKLFVSASNASSKEIDFKLVKENQEVEFRLNRIN